MLSKADRQPLVNLQTKPPKIRLSAPARGLSQWAAVDPGDRILDMACGDGALLSYYASRVHCTLCGMAATVDQYKKVREALPNAEIMYGHPQDIPWRDDAFDVVLCTLPMDGSEAPEKLLKEALRVLRPGGQLVLAAKWYPEPLRKLVSRFGGTDAEGDFPLLLRRQDMMAVFDALGFEKSSWRVSQGYVGVALGWKPLSPSTD